MSKDIKKYYVVWDKNLKKFLVWKCKRDAKNSLKNPHTTGGLMGNLRFLINKIVGLSKTRINEITLKSLKR